MRWYHLVSSIQIYSTQCQKRRKWYSKNAPEKIVANLWKWFRIFNSTKKTDFQTWFQVQKKSAEQRAKRATGERRESKWSWGVWGGKFFGFQRALGSLKIDSNFINCGCEARYKLNNSMKLRYNIIVKKNQLINVITQ